MRNDWMAEMEKKNHFLDCLRETLMVDRKRNELESMEYRYDIETKEEVIVLKFQSGREKKVPATANSNGANLIAVARAVYEPW